jgi:hypothetical protein
VGAWDPEAGWADDLDIKFFGKLAGLSDFLTYIHLDPLPANIKNLIVFVANIGINFTDFH